MDNNTKSFKSLNTVDYTLYQRCGVVGQLANGTTKEVTIGRWYGALKLDIRNWNNGALGTGISLSEDEVRELRMILDEVDFGR